MNKQMIRYVLGLVLLIEVALLLLPATASLCYGEWSVLGVFVLRCV